MYTTIGAYYFFIGECCLGWIGTIQPINRQWPKKNSNYQLLYAYGLPPGDGPRYVRNMYRLTKYTKNKLCMTLIFLCTNCMSLVQELPKHARTTTIESWAKNTTKVHCELVNIPIQCHKILDTLPPSKFSTSLESPSFSSLLSALSQVLWFNNYV